MHTYEVTIVGVSKKRSTLTILGNPDNKELTPHPLTIFIPTETLLAWDGLDKGSQLKEIKLEAAKLDPIFQLHWDKDLSPANTEDTSPLTETVFTEEVEEVTSVTL